MRKVVEQPIDRNTVCIGELRQWQRRQLDKVGKLALELQYREDVPLDEAFAQLQSILDEIKRSGTS